MTNTTGASIHASAVLVGNRAVLIRGPSGSGKSRLAFDLILAGRSGQIPVATLIGDDRVHLEHHDGSLTVRPAPALAGLIEIRGLGIRRCEFVARATVGLVVDLSAADAERLPPTEKLRTQIAGIELPRVPVESGFFPLPMVVAALTTTVGSQLDVVSDDCMKGNRNHIGDTLATE